MKHRRWYRKFLLGLLTATLLFSIGYSIYYIHIMVPNRIHVVANEKESFNFGLPFGARLESQSKEVLLGTKSNIPGDQITISMDAPFSVYGDKLGEYEIGLKLFGWLKLKNIRVDVVRESYVMPSGQPIGVYLKSDGVMVIGTGKISDGGGNEKEPAYGIVKSGDYLEAVDGIPLKNKEQLVDYMKASTGNTVVLSLRRGKESISVKVTPATDATGSYKLGLWIRSDTHGIGTLTYVEQSGKFGALGHGISDVDTGSVIEIKEGLLYPAVIHQITKGTMGVPGSLGGTINYRDDKPLGTIYKNCDSGIFGMMEEAVSTGTAPVPVGFSQDITTGPATILCGADGTVREYEIEIIKVDTSNKNTKSMVIQVVDEDLLALTGGIVQGMSGSPILQNGRLIGAVTHVFVQDSTKGYGIFLENMLAQ